MRTRAPHIPYAARAVSIASAKEAKRRRRPPAGPSPSLLDVRGAAQKLTDAGHGVFTNGQLQAQLARAGCGWTAATVSDLLEQEVAGRRGATIERVSRGRYRLRGDGGASQRALARPDGTARDHVCAAIAEMSGQVTAVGFGGPEVHQHLAEAGVVFSRSTICSVLRRLSKMDPPVLQLVGYARYVLAGDPLQAPDV